jgi:hypothetical protein
MITDAERIEIMEAYRAILAARQKFAAVEPIMTNSLVPTGSRLRILECLRCLEKAEETAAILAETFG